MNSNPLVSTPKGDSKEVRHRVLLIAAACVVVAVAMLGIAAWWDVGQSSDRNVAVREPYANKGAIAIQPQPLVSPPVREVVSIRERMPEPADTGLPLVAPAARADPGAVGPPSNPPTLLDAMKRAQTGSGNPIPSPSAVSPFSPEQKKN
jgi:hypothetical protein